MPAVSPLVADGFPSPSSQLKVTIGVPPETVAETEPSLPPLQDASVAVALDQAIAGLTVIVLLAVFEQPSTSVTVTV